MRVVVQLLGRWPMYGLAGESKRGSFTDTDNAIPKQYVRVASQKRLSCGQPSYEQLLMRRFYDRLCRERWSISDVI